MSRAEAERAGPARVWVGCECTHGATLAVCALEMLDATLMAALHSSTSVTTSSWMALSAQSLAASCDSTMAFDVRPETEEVIRLGSLTNEDSSASVSKATEC